MTETTNTEFSTWDLPTTLISGTPKRRAIVVFRGTSTATGDTYQVASAVPNAADVEGILWSTVDSIATGAPTWSTTTVTVVNIGTVEQGLLVNIT